MVQRFCYRKLIFWEERQIVSKCLQDEPDVIGCTKISTDGRAEACFAHFKLFCFHLTPRAFPGQWHVTFVVTDRGTVTLGIKITFLGSDKHNKTWIALSVISLYCLLCNLSTM